MFARFYLSALVAAGLNLANASPLVARQDVCDRTYTVQAGDTCDSISVAQRVSSFQLAHDNPAIAPDCSNLFVGEVLCLGFEGQDCTDIHVVAGGDTCNAIAAGADIAEATLLANNPNVNAGCTNLVVGEVLCTANEIINFN